MMAAGPEIKVFPDESRDFLVIDPFRRSRSIHHDRHRFRHPDGIRYLDRTVCKACGYYILCNAFAFM